MLKRCQRLLWETHSPAPGSQLNFYGASLQAILGPGGHPVLVSSKVGPHLLAEAKQIVCSFGYTSYPAANNNQARMPRDTQLGQKGSTGSRVSSDLYSELFHKDPKIASQGREAKERKCTEGKAFTKETESIEKAKWKL